MTIDRRFFDVLPTNAADLASIAGCELKGDGARQVDDAAPVSKAGHGDLTFLSGEPDHDVISSLDGAVVVTTSEISSRLPESCICLVTNAPRRDFARALASLVTARPDDWTVPATDRQPGIEIGPGASIASDVRIGEGTVIEAGAVIHRGVTLGRGCRIGANTVLSHCDLGDEVVVGAASVIGGEGFGFEITPDGPVLLPHVGSVTIGDLSRLGAGCAVDRGTLGRTAIGCRVMIDNLVHIAHNCRIDDRAVLAAQVGLAGGVEIGEGAMLAGQAGVSPQLKIGRGAVVMGQSGVTKDVPEDQTVVGFPAAGVREVWRDRAVLKRLIAKAGKRKE